MHLKARYAGDDNYIFGRHDFKSLPIALPCSYIMYVQISAMTLASRRKRNVVQLVALVSFPDCVDSYSS